MDRTAKVRMDHGQPEDLPSWEIRPGVRFPDWAAIRSPNAELALKDIFALLNIERFWDNYGGTEDLLRRTILLEFAGNGRAPTPAELAGKARLPEGQARETLKHLHDRDLIVFDADQDRILGAYPFTEGDTEHKVRFGASSVNAMCAVDALGAGAMYARDITIDSRCRACGAPIRATTRNEGTKLSQYSPQSAIVWTGLRYADNCAATSLCTVMAFFCSDTHLEEWRAANHPKIQGHRLSMEEAHELGIGIFGPMIRTAS